MEVGGLVRVMTHMVAVGDGRVTDGVDHKMLLTVDGLRQRRQLDSARNGVQGIGLEH